jgi:hypothetical protein
MERSEIRDVRQSLFPDYASLHPGYKKTVIDRHCEPTGRANARPMTGSAKQSSLRRQKESWIASSQGLLAMTLEMENA